ncbi:MAG: TatD family hydrolase [Desulfamplus sp.]|nr:TatD family hydrolase [Desulfamplus sp.]
MISNRKYHFFDAHSHLQEPEIMWDIEGMLARWQQIGGKGIVCCGTKESDWQSVARISSQYDNVLPSFGVHPWFVENVSEKWFDNLDNYLDIRFQGKTPFIGEIGLDHVIKNIDREKQKLVFKTQIQMAIERKIPVSIHMRKGWDALIKILKHTGPLGAGGIIHSYSGSADMVPLLEKYGLYISFSGSVTHPENKKARKSLKKVSPDRLLIETDSPAILPRYPFDPDARHSFDPDELFELTQFVQSQTLYETGWNEPCNILLVALAVSMILDTSLGETAQITALNGETLFNGIAPSH